MALDEKSQKTYFIFNFSRPSRPKSKPPQPPPSSKTGMQCEKYKTFIYNAD